MPNSMSGANISRLVKWLVRSAVRCGKECGKVGGKVPVLPGQGSLRRIFFRTDPVDLMKSTDWKYLTTSVV